MENIISHFKNISKITSIEGGSSIKGVRGAEIKGTPFYRVYETKLQFNPTALQAVDQTHSHFFYHIPRDQYPKDAFDYYVVDGAGNKLLNIIAYSILYFLIILAISSIFIPFYLLNTEK